MKFAPQISIQEKQIAPKKGDAQFSLHSWQIDGFESETKQQQEIINQDQMTFNNHSQISRNEITPLNLKCNGIKLRINDSTGLPSEQIEFQVSDNFRSAFNEINASLHEIKLVSESQNEILEDMSVQSDKLSTSISYLRQFMFIHNINFDNSKFIQENLINKRDSLEFSARTQNQSHGKNISQQLPHQASQNKTSISGKIPNIKSSNLNSKERIQQNQLLTIGVQKGVSQNQNIYSSSRGDNYQILPQKEVGNNQGSSLEKISNNSFNNQQQNQTHQQLNPPSKLSGLLSSILEERKIKDQKGNSTISKR